MYILQAYIKEKEFYEEVLSVSFGEVDVLTILT